jgi:hypothetical protein
MINRSTIIFILSVLLISPLLLGEEPPRLSRKWLAEAEEKIDIRIIEVETKDVSDPPYLRKLVNLRAEVTAIRESRSGLQRGAVIFIIYLHRYDTIPGPSSIPILKEGHSYRAYLNRNRNSITPANILIEGWDGSRQYSPAALGKSFEEVR